MAKSSEKMYDVKTYNSWIKKFLEISRQFSWTKLSGCCGFSVVTGGAGYSDFAEFARGMNTDNSVAYGLRCGAQIVEVLESDEATRTELHDSGYTRFATVGEYVYYQTLSSEAL